MGAQKDVTAKTIIFDFCFWSTVACVRNVAVSTTKWLRIFWFVIFVIMCGVFVYQLVVIILRVLDHPSSLSTSINFEAQQFPQVTFCNFNPYKLNVVNKNPNFSDIKQLEEEFQLANQNVSTYNVFGLEGLSKLERMEKASDILAVLASQLSDQEKEPALYTFNEVVTDCLFSGIKCTSADFSSFIDPVYGRCFVLNANKTITRAGLSFGLRLILTVNQDESKNFAYDFLPTTYKAGMRITVNTPEYTQSLDTRGMNVGVGFQTSVALTKHVTERAKKPYGTCVDHDPQNSLYPDKNYTMETCFISCLQRETVKRCGCANPQWRTGDNMTTCSTVEDADCLQELKGNQLDIANPNLNALLDCGCFPACYETIFSSTISVLSYPSVDYSVGVGTTEQNNNMKEEQFNLTTTTTTSTTTTTKAPTTTTTTLATTTTKPTSAPATTSTSGLNKFGCPPSSTPYQAELDQYFELIKYDEQNNCKKPRYKCRDPKAKWWQCFPCHFTCPDGTERPLPQHQLTDIKCDDYFDMGPIEQTWSGPSPQFSNWYKGDDPPQSKCNPEEEMEATTTVKATTTTKATTTRPTTTMASTTKAPTTTPLTTTTTKDYGTCNPPNSNNMNQGTVQGYLFFSGMYEDKGNEDTQGRKIIVPKNNNWDWKEKFPCYYVCPNGCKTPESQTLPCSQMFKYYTVDVTSMSNKPTFAGWDSGTNPTDSSLCPEPEGGGGWPWGRRKKRGILDGLFGGGSTSTTTTKPTSPSGGGPNMDVAGRGSCEDWNANFGSVADCKQWYKRNGMILNVFFESLKYEVLTESPAYTISAAINDLGGQAGLWLGLSVISLVECAGLVLLLFFYCITGGRIVRSGKNKKARQVRDETKGAAFREMGHA